MKTVGNIERTKLISVEASIAEQDSLMSEQFRKLRNMLNIHYLANYLRSVLVTSFVPNEGKTTVSLNMSATIAKSCDNSVILIDADVRKKSISHLLGLQNDPGLSDILKGEADFDEIIFQTDIANLYILPSGNDTADALDLLNPIRVNNLLKQLSQRYEDCYIIIDSAPLLVASETISVSHIVDGIIIVIMADNTRRDVVKRELGAINKEKILGVVLNATDFEMSHHYHKYYKHYYRKEKE